MLRALSLTMLHRFRCHHSLLPLRTSRSAATRGGAKVADPRGGGQLPPFERNTENVRSTPSG
eukprot:6483351-Alexandrium_andersonii.AAC.1